ncbi:MAG: hypothetical protein EHM35_00315 [Planctomycetaceae bacterium]|nr:MAG: hypothetical protein EHM35_00315 [Planctomycetaceae bacterium]
MTRAEEIAAAREFITAVWPEGFSHIVATVRDFNKIAALKDQPCTGYVIARFLGERFNLEGVGAPFMRALLTVADAEIDAATFELQPSLASCFLMFDRYCIGGRA